MPVAVERGDRDWWSCFPRASSELMRDTGTCAKATSLCFANLLGSYDVVALVYTSGSHLFSRAESLRKEARSMS